MAVPIETQLYGHITCGVGGRLMLRLVVEIAQDPQAVYKRHTSLTQCNSLKGLSTQNIQSPSSVRHGTIATWLGRWGWGQVSGNQRCNSIFPCMLHTNSIHFLGTLWSPVTHRQPRPIVATYSKDPSLTTAVLHPGYQDNVQLSLKPQWKVKQDINRYKSLLLSSLHIHYVVQRMRIAGCPDYVGSASSSFAIIILRTITDRWPNKVKGPTKPGVFR